VAVAVAGNSFAGLEEVPADSSRLVAVDSHLVEDNRRHMIAGGTAERPAGNIPDSTWRQCYVGAGNARELRYECCSMVVWTSWRRQMDVGCKKMRREGRCPGDTETSACPKAWVLGMPRFRWRATQPRTREA